MSMMIQLLFTLTITGSSIVACLLVLRLLMSNASTSKWHYRIGKMAIVFFLIPIAHLIEWIFSWLPFYEVASGQGAGEGYPVVSYKPLWDSLSFSITADIAILLISIWGIGVIVFVGWQVYCYRSFLKKIQHTYKSVPKHTEAAKQLTLMKEVLSIKSNVRLAYSMSVRSPVLIGLWKPTIYLPVENHEKLDMSMVIHHELIHVKRKDLWFKALMLGANALHWFNPFAYILRRNMHIWSELTCDEEVVKEMPHTERKRYGETILNVMIGSRNLPVRFCSSLSGNGKQLKRRLNMMIHVKKTNKRTMIFSIVTMIVIGIIGASTSVWASTKSPEVGAIVGNVDELEENVLNSDSHEKTSELNEVKMISIEEATDKQIQEYRQQLGSVSDAELLADVEEDAPATIEIESKEGPAEEAEEVIFVEVDSK